MLTPNEINEKLEQYKDCKQIRINIINGNSFVVNYADIKNETEYQIVSVDAKHDWDKRTILYSAIKSIQPE